MNTNDPNVVPTVAIGAEPLGTPPVTDTGETPAVETPVVEQKTDPQPILGKYKSVDELINAHQELEKALGKQGAELGDLRKQNELYGKALEMVKPPATQEQRPTETNRDFASELSAIQQKVDSGEMTSGEGLLYAAQIATDKAKADARQEYQRFDSERQTKTAEQQFLEKNPDFEQVLNSGALNQYFKDNPLHNNLSAYLQYQMDQRLAAANAEKEEATKAAFEKGKSEVQKLAEGSKVAETVISKPGSEMRNEKPTKTLDERELRAGMLNRLNQIRGG